MRLPDSAWEFAFVLPNLVLPVDSDDTNPGAFPQGLGLPPDMLRIFPGEHEVVKALRASSPVVEQILSSFRNEYGKPYYPAVLLFRSAASEQLKRDLEAFVAFRNAIAMSVILRGRAGVVVDRSNEVTWSDTFDFHPVQIGGRGRMILQSPALLSLVSSSQVLQLTHSAYVQIEGRRLWPDHYLLRALGKAWKRRFTPNPKRDPFGQRLFRSLEVAYQACAVGAKNQGSLHEYGIQIALWVSACEILAWADRRRADLTAVLNLLARYPGMPATTRKRFRIKHRGQRIALSAPQKAYAYLYDARNAFLHGNRVTIDTMVKPSRAEESIGLPRVAAIVYRSALAAYLDKRYHIELAGLRNWTATAMEMFDNHRYEEGFAAMFGYTI